MFLIRFAFWMTLVVALIPVSREDLGPDQRAVSTQETILAAQAVVQDFRRFCERNQSACETGGELFSQLGTKAATGARHVSAYLEQQFGGKTNAESEGTKPDATLTGGIKG